MHRTVGSLVFPIVFLVHSMVHLRIRPNSTISMLGSWGFNVNFIQPSVLPVGTQGSVRHRGHCLLIIPGVFAVIVVSNNEGRVKNYGTIFRKHENPAIVPAISMGYVLMIWKWTSNFPYQLFGWMEGYQGMPNAPQPSSPPPWGSIWLWTKTNEYNMVNPVDHHQFRFIGYTISWDDL